MTDECPTGGMNRLGSGPGSPMGACMRSHDVLPREKPSSGRAIDAAGLSSYRPIGEARRLVGA
jgi:hypothetical protein